MITRRGFARTSVLAAIVMALGAGCEGIARPIVLRDERTTRAARRAEKLVDRGAADVIGGVRRAALLPDGDEASAAALVEPTVALLDTDEPIDALRARIAQLVTGDLLEDHIDDLEGWTMSATELSICLLVHLVEP
ncbi:hypothetical protein [Sandaracinus amylolyticus]|uniref:Lipoprotein n=1 Tax=Sandaracinus amylolyticus TaxID=927083 RepID=A0A0F6YJI7_9BACT|nr:hypothetical protein [Sandaracinus amylolyticus]AKF07866.1 hypothetical protein DB32_005015 [Sandaracinus amylolyticus]